MLLKFIKLKGEGERGNSQFLAFLLSWQGTEKELYEVSLYCFYRVDRRKIMTLIMKKIPMCRQDGGAKCVIHCCKHLGVLHWHRNLS